jgi:exodeoxyribonuclease VII small subunit
VRGQASRIRMDGCGNGKSRFLFDAAVLSLTLPVSNKPKSPGAELNFEGAMDRLEAIVGQMESGKLALEDLIVRYEEGMKLVKICQDRLANAEQKFEIIARNSAGKPVVKDFEPGAEGKIDNQIGAANPSDAGAAEVKETKNDEIRLF